MAALDDALAALLRAGRLEALRIEATVRPAPPDPPPPDPADGAPPITFTVGPVRTKG